MLIHLKTPQGKQILWPPFRIPPKNIKSIVLVITQLLFMATMILYFPGSLFFRMLLAFLLLFPFTACCVALLQIPTKLYHAFLINKARVKLRAHKPMKVIGITGSYGKTSTKEYLSTILSTQYKVLKTEASKNSPIGIAELVLKDLKDEHEVFVVEMGAYKKGEIAAMCALVQPQIGIVTAVNAQHQDLFKSIETTKEAKYELLESLSGEKIAIVNGDNPHTVEMGSWAKRDGCIVWEFSRDKKSHLESKAHLYYFDIVGDLKGTSFTISDGHAKANVRANVLGDHQATNLTAAISGAIAAGMKLSDAAAGCAQVQSYTKTMKPVLGLKQALFINDTFNNNPDAAMAAIRFMSKVHKGRKILVFQPMIELGSFADTSHMEVGATAASICDDIILTNTNFNEPFLLGVQSIKRTVHCTVMAPEQAAQHIRESVKKDDIILFKGKEAERVFNLLV